MICEVRVEKGHLLYGNSKVSKKNLKLNAWLNVAQLSQNCVQGLHLTMCKSVHTAGDSLVVQKTVPTSFFISLVNQCQVSLLIIFL